MKEIGKFLIEIAKDVAGFALISLILGYLLRGKVKEGFEKMSKLMAGTFEKILKNDVLPIVKSEIEHTRLDILKAVGTISMLKEEIRIDEARAKLNQGDIRGAEEVLEKKLSKEPTNANLLQEYVDVLLMPRLLEKNDEAWEVLKKADYSKVDIGILLRLHLRVSYSYYSLGSTKRAIEVDEKGLKIAEENINKQEAAKRILKFKNSLAYYYADVGDSLLEELARKYSEECAEKRKDDPVVEDTCGFVKIVFGKNREEILEGVKLCEDARRKSYPFEFYFKHINKANSRLSSLTKV